LKPPAGAGESPGAPRLSWALAAASLAYVVFVHHGIGPGPTGALLRWYEPRGFLLQWAWLGWAFESTPRLVVVLTLPAIALSLAVVAAGGPALACSLSVICALATPLTVFYGDAATRVWVWFGWRTSVVLALLATCVGLALTAPLLAASWLRLRWPARIAAWLPFAFAAVAFLRNATGTDPSLRFNLSPWPAVPVFGLELAALLIATWILGVAIGLRGVAAWRRGPGGAARLALGVALGIATPVLMLVAGSQLSLLPFRVHGRELVASALVTALAIGLAASLGVAGAAEATRRRSHHSAVGAALVLVPILVGQAWAFADYHATREGRARQIIGALEAWYQREGTYPDELDLLIESGDLAEIPRPAIGFAFLYDGEFRYRSFGTSFLIEFPATRWVECAYTPPYDAEGAEDEDPGDLEFWERPLPPAKDAPEGAAGSDAASATQYAAEPDAAGADAGGSLGGSWSCPSKPPELW